MTLVTTTLDGTPPFPITEYKVGRTIDGEPADLGHVTATWSGPSRNITVRLGQGDPPDDPALRVRNVRMVDIAAQSPQNWSNLVLQLEGSLTGRAQCVAVADSQSASVGKGGRISGQVGGPLYNVYAQSVGLGEDLAGNLFVNGNLTLLHLAELVPDAELTAASGIGPTIITGNSSGVIRTTALYALYGRDSRVEIGGNLTGTIELTNPQGRAGFIRVDGDIAASAIIHVAGSTSVDIIANADEIGGGSILGQVVIDNAFSGNICGDNIVSGSALPGNIRIFRQDGGMRICDAAANLTCQTSRPARPVGYPPSNPTKRNRFLSLSVAETSVSAIRVRLTNLQDPWGMGFSSFENGSYWVGPPFTALEAKDNPSLGSFRAARLQCTPHFQDWSSEGVVHVTGAEIIPDSTYEVRVVKLSCAGSIAFDSVFSSPLTLTTSKWGDVIGPGGGPPDGVVDGLDIVAIVDRFKNRVGAQSRVVTSLQPNALDLFSDLSALDVVEVVNAFKGNKYPYSGPCPCPSAKTCPLGYELDCINTGTCGGGMCMKACVGGDHARQPCRNDADCPGGTCYLSRCFDRCGRCSE